MIKLFHSIKSFWHNYSTASKTLKPLPRFAIALIVHIFRLPACSWRTEPGGKISLILFTDSRFLAEKLMAQTDELRDREEQYKKVMR